MIVPQFSRPVCAEQYNGDRLILKPDVKVTVPYLSSIQTRGKQNRTLQYYLFVGDDF